MADLSGVTDKYFTVASETFTDNLSSSIAAGAATVPVNNNSEYTNGDDVVLTVDPGTVNEATFIGRKSGLNFINCVWTEGNLAVGHSNGATIIDYDSATHHNAQTKGIQQFANSDGTLKTQPVRDALGLGATTVNGWEVFAQTIQVSTGYNLGNRRYQITVTNNDATGVLSKGMWLRGNRGTAGSTQCADFESSSSQYATRVSGSLTGNITTFTDDITAEAWVKCESYVAGTANNIVSRYNGTSGWHIYMEPDGRITMVGRNAGATNYRGFTSVGTVPLGRWVHIAGTLDMSGQLYTCYINGVSVAANAITGGTSPTALVQAGDLQIGAHAGANFFDGKISDVRVWNVVRTATQIRDNMNQVLVGTETNLVGYWKLDGNFNDSTASANNLTAQGGVVATTLDTPMNNFYAKIVDISFSSPNTILTVIAAEGYDVPNLTLSAPYYSTQDQPYGIPDITKFKSSVWEQTVSDLIAKYLIEETTDEIRYINPGTFGGTWFYRQVGSRKEIHGVSNAVTTTGAGPKTFSLTLPVGFFSSIRSGLITMAALTTYAEQYAHWGAGINTTTATGYIVTDNAGGAASTGTVYGQIVGI